MPDLEGVTEGVLDFEGVTEGVLDFEAVPVIDGVAEGVPVLVGVTVKDGLREGVPVIDGVAEGVPVLVGVTVIDGLREGVPEFDGVPVFEGVGVVVAVEVSVCKPDPLVLAELFEEAEEEADSLIAILFDTVFEVLGLCIPVPDTALLVTARETLGNKVDVYNSEYVEFVVGDPDWLGELVEE